MTRSKTGKSVIKWLAAAVAGSWGFFVLAQEPKPAPVEPQDQARPGQDNSGAPAAYALVDAAKEAAAAGKSERISLDLKGINIYDLFRILSIKTGATIVPSKGVSGRVNIFLNNVTFDDALDVIMVSQGFAMERNGNVVYIMTNEEYRKLYGEEYVENREMVTYKLRHAKATNALKVLNELKSSIGKIIIDEASGTVMIIDVPEKNVLLEDALRQMDQPLRTAAIDLNYADPDKIKEQIGPMLTQDVGKLVTDARSRKAIITDLPSRIDEIAAMVKNIDEESRQVEINAEIVEVTLSNTFQRGIDWQKVFKSFNSSDGTSFQGYFPFSSSLADYQRISMGTLYSDLYTVAIKILETYGTVKTISRPNITVVSGEEGKIMVGTREAYVTQTTSQGETTITSENVQFIDVGIKLSVAPKINKDGFITLSIKPEVSSTGTPLKTSLGSIIPIVNTSEAETVIKVKDGVMVMMGGLIKEDKKVSDTGIPGLSKVPILGMMFSKHSTETVRKELVIFLTPHLVRGTETLLSVDSPELPKYIPGDIMPEDIKAAMLLRELDAIGGQDEQESGSDQQGIDKKMKGLQ